MSDDDKVIAAVDSLRDEIVDLTARLVRIPTVNPPGERYPEAARLLGTTLHGFGYAVE